MGPSEKNFFDSLNKRSNSMHNDKTYAPASFVYFENWNDTVCLRAAPLHRLVPSSHGSYKLSLYRLLLPPRRRRQRRRRLIYERSCHPFCSLQPTTSVLEVTRGEELKEVTRGEELKGGYHPAKLIEGYILREKYNN
ncbi:hypothetical protein HAX54_006372 [Datura stramonium]|uniref:Uncharacterized protein n=1 Tax=Datura stramonium TaxID=4076 RepID=A0ABS8WU07_DATST|nr:hypothetical protein [Datura stramonium]